MRKNQWSVGFSYGTCDIGHGFDPGGCSLPVSISNEPACSRNLAMYGGALSAKPHLTRVRGTTAAFFEGGSRLEIQTGTTTVVIFAFSKRKALAVAKNLRGLNVPVSRVTGSTSGARRGRGNPSVRHAVTRSRFPELAVLVVLLGAAAYEAAVALEWIPVGTEPGENARFEGLVMALASLALLAGVAISLVLAARDRRSVLAAMLPGAATALMVAVYYTFDTYYLPTLTRYSESGAFSPTWVYGWPSPACRPGSSVSRSPESASWSGRR